VSDQSQGAGWWQASDGKWYPPSQAAQATPPAPPAPGSAYGPPTAPVAQPGMAYPAGDAVAQPAKQGMSGCAKAALVVLVLGLILGGGCVIAAMVFSDEVADSIDDITENGREDVDITSCERDDAGFMVAELEITNSSSGRSQYTVIVEFESSDGTESIQSTLIPVGGVDPGETTEVEARSTVAASEELECGILEAFRLADEGDTGN
jgi:hypothetical protein